MSDTVNTALITIITSQCNTGWGVKNDSESLTFSIKSKSGIQMEIEIQNLTK